MTVVDLYYDFRSPFAYFAAHRIRSSAFSLPDVEWRWHPVSIGALINFQASREAFETFADPLAPPKRRHFMTDVVRSAEYRGAPIKTPKPQRPDTAPALYIAAHSGSETFRDAVFHAMWREQRDIGNAEVLRACAVTAGVETGLVDSAMTDGARQDVADRSRRAYASGIFGVPTFVFDGEVFFGNDRMDVLAWRVRQKTGSDQPVQQG
jgi:2-hydroxychromene-2-carboxylate isomerase